jgi:NAD(P)-dependent dehydrogenase (short-subunit alcohol dehydrogenase family)
VELLDAGNKINMAVGSPKPKSQIVTMGIAGAFARGNRNFIYDGSKAATHAIIKNLATSLVPWDIRCNVIAPGC